MPAKIVRGTIVFAIGASIGASIFGGCGAIQNLSPERRLTDHVYMLNDEARWGRVDLAAMRCDNEYRPRFVTRHRAWGRAIRIADADVTNVIMGQERTSSLVTYQWIDERTMEMSETIVRQDWTAAGDGYHLSGEEIIDGGALFGLDEGETTTESASPLAASVRVASDAQRRDRPIDAQGVVAGE